MLQIKGTLWMRRGLTTLAGLFLVSALILPGCGGGGGSSSGDAGAEGKETSEMAITLTDAPSDFASYTVDVVAIDLKKANGAEVHTLPITQRVDFSQYTDMTEFVTACTIPSGVYTEATLTLDYSNADIRLEDNNANIVRVMNTNIVDVNGNPVTIIKVTVNLGLPALTILPGVASHLALDFNLKASNSVDFTNGIPTVTVSPVLLANLVPDLTKTHRARGMLAEVDTDQGFFTMAVKPFIHKISGDQGRFGTLKVVPSQNTIYIIDNVQFQGADGLAALALPAHADAPVLVLGRFKINPNLLEAQEVYVGTSVPGGKRDVAGGNVIARSGNTITIRGASLVRSTGQLDFCNTVMVNLVDGNTVVSKQLSKGILDIDAISVGQRIVVFGTAGNLDGNGNLTMTATAARMLITHLRGIVQSSKAHQMVMTLEAIDGRKPGGFSLTDAGADPANYVVATSANLAAQSRVNVWGFVNSFGHTDEADFNAQTVINISTIPSILCANWKMQGYERAFTATSPTRLELDLTLNRLGRFHFLNRAGVVDDLTTDFAGMPISITAPEDGSASFCIVQGISFRAYSNFAEFVVALEERINKGDEVLSVSALGQFDDLGATMKARWLVVRFAL